MGDIVLPKKLEQEFQGSHEAVRVVRYNFDGEYCLSGGTDKLVKLWNPEKGALLKTYSAHSMEVADVESSHDNSQICSGASDKLVILWDVTSGQAIRRFRFHSGRVNAVKFNGDSSVLLSASIDGSVAVWDCKSKAVKPIQVINEAQDSVTSICVFDWHIYTASLDCNIRKYDIRQGELTCDYVGHPVTSLVVTRDGQCVLANCQDESLRLFDVSTGELLNSYAGLKNSKYKIDCGLLSSDTHLVSGSEDGSIKIWDLLTTNLVSSLPHASASVVHSLSPHPTENKLLSAARDRIYLWHPD